MHFVESSTPSPTKTPEITYQKGFQLVVDKNIGQIIYY